MGEIDVNHERIPPFPFSEDIERRWILLWRECTVLYLSRQPSFLFGTEKTFQKITGKSQTLPEHARSTKAQLTLNERVCIICSILKREDRHSFMVELDSIVEGKVVGITRFGAFVELEDGKRGLVHISEIANHFVKDVNDYLKINDRVKVKVIGISPDGKIDLSIKRVNEDKEYIEKLERSKANFEQKMNRFLKQSQEKLSDLKKYRDGKKKR
jgi:S1 RNA binding domain protein